MLICDVMKWKMGFKVNIENIEINNVEEKKVEKLNLPMFISIVKDKIKT